MGFGKSFGAGLAAAALAAGGGLAAMGLAIIVDVRQLPVLVMEGLNGLALGGAGLVGVVVGLAALRYAPGRGVAAGAAALAGLLGQALVIAAAYLAPRVADRYTTGSGPLAAREVLAYDAAGFAPVLAFCVLAALAAVLMALFGPVAASPRAPERAEETQESDDALESTLDPAAGQASDEPWDDEPWPDEADERWQDEPSGPAPRGEAEAPWPDDTAESPVEGGPPASEEPSGDEAPGGPGTKPAAAEEPAEETDDSGWDQAPAPSWAEQGGSSTEELAEEDETQPTEPVREQTLVCPGCGEHVLVEGGSGTLFSCPECGQAGKAP